jgi:hypothetical protein
MSAYTKVTVACDWPDCYGRIETHRWRITEARADAAKNGWKQISGIDLCGAKEQADKYDNSRYSLNGHAARTDHLPVVKQSRKGHVMLSCSCGWVRKSEYSWQKEGEVARSMVDHYWSGHVKEALKAAEAEAAEAADES